MVKSKMRNEWRREIPVNKGVHIVRNMVMKDVFNFGDIQTASCHIRGLRGKRGREQRRGGGEGRDKQGSIK